MYKCRKLNWLLIPLSMKYDVIFIKGSRGPSYITIDQGFLINLLGGPEKCTKLDGGPLTLSSRYFGLWCVCVWGGGGGGDNQIILTEKKDYSNVITINCP